MITIDNFKALLISLDFQTTDNQIYTKHLAIVDTSLSVDFEKKMLIYPKELIVHAKFTLNFSSPENFVVFECVHSLLAKGYKPEHIELEAKWNVGHGPSGGRADILVKNQLNEPLLLIECKTEGKEFDKAWKDTLADGGQLFSYAQQISETSFLCLYASDFDEKENTFTRYQRIISHKDNEQILSQDNKLKGFKDATNVKNRFEVWKNTYKQEYLESGIFETNIQAYQIGKEKYTLLEDTHPVTDKDIKGKYHQFRTILRKHNIARKENAFEVLVNLFLCKIVDEENNKENLQFYWKGIVYDNYFDLIDRLQGLYKSGMEKFLAQEITYISNQEIDEAFWTVKAKRNATKQVIQDYFRKLKFFTNNAFAFMDVHNEKLFHKNAKVLLEILQMWQSLRLKTEDKNQFLGDMFEYFLDNSIKQSEGQFFTPVPICKFIVMSLPLEDRIKKSKQIPKAIDYACGAGHFLNEYASQIKPFVEAQKNVNIKDYYREIYGIEKEDRLAKIAKISAFMYRQDDIRIFDADALASNPDIKLESFDVLVANPPFSVEGFLETLPEEDREKYELFNTIADNNNRNIQCFFIERAKQLLAPNAVAGIIVPSSVLSNSDATHVASREILLKYFDIVALVELGSGTFGKTGTNTVVLFLRRKALKPEPAEHYANRVNDFYEDWAAETQTNGGMYQDVTFIHQYCTHINIPFAEYQALFSVKENTFDTLTPLLQHEMFQDYQQDFLKSTDIVNLQKKKFFKDWDKADQQKELNKRFIAYLQKIEKDKLYYFMLAQNNPQKVLIIKSPSDNKEQKQFLGYEWSGAKGQEGIKYAGGESISDIVTPLFDANNPYNTEKINYYIQQNFLGNRVSVSETLAPFISYSNLIDMLDFSRKSFDKAFSLTIKKKVGIQSKWEMVKLGIVAEVIAGQSPESEYYNDLKNGLSFYQGKKDFGAMFLEESTVWTTKITKESIKNDILMSVRAPVGDVNINPFDKICIGRGLAAIRNQNEKTQKYLFEFINQNKYLFKGNLGTTFESISTNDLKEIKIPLPPLDIQAKIVEECEQIDKAVDKAKEEIEKSKEAIAEKVANTFLQGYTTKKISEICLINPSKTEIRNVDENTLVSFIEMASVSNEGFITNKEDRLLKDLKKGSFTYFRENDIIIAKITPCMENGKCALAKGLTNGLAMGSSEFHVFRVKENIIPDYLFAFLNRKEVRKEAEQKMTGSSGHRRVPASFYEDIYIPVPSISIQQTLVSEIEVLEARISAAQQIIVSAAGEKQRIMEQYL